MSSWVSWLRLLRRKDILTLAPSGSPFRNADKTLRQFSRGSGLHRRVGREVLASVRSSALRRIRSIGPSSWPAPSPGSTNQAGVRSCSRYRIDIKSAPAMMYWQGDWWSRSRSRQRSKECHFRPPRTFGNGSGVPLAESQEALPGTSAQGRTIFVSTVVSSAFVLCVVLPLDPAALGRTGRKLQRQMAAARAEIAPSQARRVRQARRGEPQHPGLHPA